MRLQDNIRVLIVEDNALVSEMIQGLLEVSGFIVAGRANDGRQAIKMTKELRPDVIMMDLNMPDMDGNEVMRRIQETCPTPIVVLTAHDTPELVAQAGDAGAGAYLVKPSNTYEMERAIIIAMARFDDMMKLRHLNAELEVRNAELDAFAHTVAHDLKNPLNLINGFVHVLEDSCADSMNEEQLKYLRVISWNGRKMGNIIDELLILSQVRKIEVEMEPLDMARIVRDSLNRLAFMIETQKPKMIIPQEWPAALGHAAWIEEVWTNYLSNAIQYGGRPPVVELGYDVPQNGMVRYWVRDNGAGLTAEEQARLFTPFERLDQVSAKGHGLGLSIVLRILEKLGGLAEVESVPGEGSVFSFTLPAANHSR
ncbi:MAG: response regulator [Anaerolineae bacterium]